MARVPLIDENDPSTEIEVREALLAAGKSRGRVVNVFRALANRPEALNALFTLSQAVYTKNSTLEPQHAELAYLTSTSVNDCFY